MCDAGYYQDVSILLLKHDRVPQSQTKLHQEYVRWRIVEDKKGSQFPSSGWMIGPASTTAGFNFPLPKPGPPSWPCADVPPAPPDRFLHCLWPHHELSRRADSGQE